MTHMMPAMTQTRANHLGRIVIGAPQRPAVLQRVFVFFLRVWKQAKQ